MKKIKLRLFGFLLCFLMALNLLPIKTFADIPLDIAEKSNLQVVFEIDGEKAKDVTFKAYKVAAVTSSYEFTVEPKFEKADIIKLLDNPDTESYNIIATTITGFIAENTQIKPDYTAVTDKSGSAVFKEADRGLYLITGDIYKTESAYYIPQNFMVLLPTQKSDGSLNYNVKAIVKWEKRAVNEKLNLEILKIWGDSAENLHTDDNVTVKLYKNGKLYDSKILNRNNNWNYKWKNLPSDALWTVKENELKGYTASVERKKDCFVITNTPKKHNKIPPKLPQTGLLVWPVPVALSLGILLILLGVTEKRKGEK